MSVLARGAAFVRPFRTSRATLLRESTVDDGMGGTTTTWATVVIDVPCAVLRLRRLAVLEAEGAGLLSRALYTLNFDTDIDVRARDRVLVGTLTYRVQAVVKGTTFGIANEAQCALEE